MTNLFFSDVDLAGESGGGSGTSGLRPDPFPNANEFDFFSGK
jgi:hypothetical protein